MVREIRKSGKEQVCSKRAGRRKPARQRAQETCATKGAGNLRDKRAGLLEKSRKTAQQKSRKSAQQKGRFARKEQVCSRAVSLIQFVRKRAGNLLDKRAGNLPDKRAGNLLDTPGGLTIRKRAGLLESSVSHSVCLRAETPRAGSHRVTDGVWFLFASPVLYTALFRRVVVCAVGWGHRRSTNPSRVLAFNGSHG